MNKLKYNERSAKTYEWTPCWFNAIAFNDDFLKKVISFQKKHNLVADGLVGPSTYRIIWTEREANISNYKPTNRCSTETKNVIVHNSQFYDIEWDKVILWDEPDGLKAKVGNYTDYSSKPDREPGMFVNHWDVCLSSESCLKVLNKRGLSVHFLIDNDGTIFQTLDTQHNAWHAGNLNRHSVGVEISNAYYPKYQNWYIRNGFGPRPISKNAACHGRILEEHLDFYPIQIQALKALWKAINLSINIPLQGPTAIDTNVEESTNFFTKTLVDSSASSAKYKGFVSHYHLTPNKIDCAGLDIVKLIWEMQKKDIVK